MGPPHQVVELGQTHVPLEIFTDYLKDLGGEKFWYSNNSIQEN